MISPITPPDELVQQWRLDWACVPDATQGAVGLQRYIAAQASQMGWEQRGAANEAELQQRADQELEACVEWLDKRQLAASPEYFAKDLRAARRPKAPSKADQAIADLDALVADLSNHGMGFKTTNLRRALERLKELEQLND